MRGKGVITQRQARRLRRLVERRLKEFEELLAGRLEGVSAAEFDRWSKALVTLTKALQEAASLEERLPPAAARKRRKAEGTDDDLRRGLARRLEALLAETEPPRPARNHDAGGKEAGGAKLAPDGAG